MASSKEGAVPRMVFAANKPVEADML